MWGANRALPVADEAGKSPQRRQWRMQQGDFEEVPRLAATIVAGNRLAQRWAGASGRGQNFKRPPLGSAEILGTATGPPPPTECLPIALRRGRPPGRPELGLYRVPCNVSLRGRAAPVTIRAQSLPCLKGGGPAAGWWRDSCGEESPGHGFAVPASFRQGGHQPLRRFEPILIPYFSTHLLGKYFLSVIVHPKPNRL